MRGKKKAAPRAAKVVPPALCRLVLIRESTDQWHFGIWQRETSELHDRVNAFNAKQQKFVAWVQLPASPGVDTAQHITAIGGAPGQRVVRFKFKDGGTGDIEIKEFNETVGQQKDRLGKALEIETVTRRHIEYEQRQVRSETARTAKKAQREEKRLRRPRRGNQESRSGRKEKKESAVISSAQRNCFPVSVEKTPKKIVEGK